VRDDLFSYAKLPEYSAHIPGQWRPASFAIVPDAFDEGNGLLNATMKLVRHKVCELYRARIDELYASGTADPLIPGNREVLRAMLS